MLLLYRRSIRILFFIFSCPFFWSLRNLCLIVLASHDCPTYHHFGCLWRGGILRIQRQSDAFFYLREQLLASHPDPKQTIVKWLSMLFTSQITMLTLLRSDFLSRFEGGVTGEVGSSLSPRRDLFSAVEEPAASSLDVPPPDWSFLFLDCISAMHVKVFNDTCTTPNFFFKKSIRESESFEMFVNLLITSFKKLPLSSEDSTLFRTDEVEEGGPMSLLGSLDFSRSYRSSSLRCLS